MIDYILISLCWLGPLLFITGVIVKDIITGEIDLWDLHLKDLFRKD